MDISDRINEMYTHVGDVYDTITNVDLPTNKNIQNIPQTIKDSYLEIMNNGIDTIWNNWEKVTGEGTSLTLNNTYQAPMRNNLKGNTSQTGTPTPTSPIPVNVVSGDNSIIINSKNFLKLNDVAETTSHGVTYSCTNGILTLDGTVDSGGFLLDLNTFWLPSGTYYLARNGEGTTTGSWQNYLRNSSGNVRQGYGEFTTTTGQEVYYRVYGNPGVKFTNYKLKPMINIGSSAMTFEPYNGNTYNIGLPVENLWHIDSATVNGVTLTNNDDGSITLNGACTSTSQFRTMFDTPLSNDTYTLGFVSSVALNTGSLYLRTRNSSGTLAQNIDVKVTSANQTVTSDIKYLDITIISGVTYNNVNLKIQLEKGSIANSYTPYGTTPIELCKIGNYQDYFYKDSDKWYLHKEIGKKVFNGSELWYADGQDGKKRKRVDNILDGLGVDAYTIANILSNLYVPTTATNTYVGNMGIALSSNGKTILIYDENYNTSNATSFKQMLANNNLVLYYALATPTNTEITDTTLINQLEELYIAKSKENQTNISQINNDLGFIINASALKKGV